MKKNKDIDINKLKTEINHLCLSDKIDFYNGSNFEERISRCIEDEFKALITMYRQNNKSFDSIIKNALLAGPVFRKRKKIVKEFAFKANELYKDKYPNLCIYTEFCKYACEPFYCAYERLDSEEFIVEAASIYLLEELANYGLEEKAFKYMPKDDDSLSMAITHPEAEDCLFSDEVIQSMCYLFQNQTKVEKNEEANLLTIELSNLEEYELKHINNPVSNKEKLISIISLLPKKNIDRLVSNFFNDLWRLIDFIFSIENEYQNNFNDYENRVRDLLDEFEHTIKNSNNIFIDKKESLLKMSLYSSEIENIVDILEDILNAKHLLRLGTSFMHFDNTILEDEIEEEFRNKLYEFEISNPYETCFAFMYLLTINNDVVWLLNPCLTLLKAASLKLPWTKDYNVVRESNSKEQEIHEKRMKEIESLLKDSDYEDSQIYANNDKLYKLKYTDAYSWGDYHNAEEKDLLKLNFPQFCYNFSDRIPPRSLIHNFSEDKEEFLVSGFKEEEVKMMDIIHYLIESSGEKISFENNFDGDNNEDKYLDEIDELSRSNSTKNRKIEVLVERIKNLQSALNSLKKEFKNYKEEYFNDTEEIYRLRELVYTLQNKKNVKEDNTNSCVELPYYSPKKAIILGGSDTWINKMKDSISNASFLSSKQKINTDVLKNAEIIWIQIIELSHSDFYAVTNYAKTHHIPIYYFLYSNIEKCINQFTENEQSNNNKKRIH